MALHASVKRIEIDKTQTTIMATVAVGVVVTIFSLFGIKAQLAKVAYNQRVLSAKHKVVDQLKSNLKAAKQLQSAYNTFASQTPNIVGGNPSGQGNLDGNNAQIVLDALPSQYDAPALASTLEKVLGGQNVTIQAITVKDDPAGNPDKPMSSPAVRPINFSFSSQGTYQVNQQTLKDFERSIRPFDVQTMSLSGSDNVLTMTVTMNTFFQPPKALDLTNTQVVK